MLYNINGATNAVQIMSTSLQESTFVGQGAGRFPTANSCVSDILAIAQGETGAPFPKQAPAGTLTFSNSFTSAFGIPFVTTSSASEYPMMWREVVVLVCGVVMC